MGSFQDSTGTAVVLLKFNNFSALEVTLEIKNISKVSSTPAIDRLPVITNYANVARLTH
jgi:hypothetical protein